MEFLCEKLNFIVFIYFSVYKDFLTVGVISAVAGVFILFKAKRKE